MDPTNRLVVPEEVRSRKIYIFFFLILFSMRQTVLLRLNGPKRYGIVRFVNFAV